METMPVVEVTTFSGSHLLYQKLFVLLENALISRNYSFQWKPLFLVETIGLWQYSFHLVETVPFNGRHFLRCPENCPRVKLPPRLGSGFGLGLALELGLGGNFPSTNYNLSTHQISCKNKAKPYQYILDQKAKLITFFI